MVQNSKGPKPSSHFCAPGTLQLHTGTLVLVSCISFQYFVYLQANVSQTFLSEKILVLAWASITKYHRLGGINNRNLFPHHSGGWVTVLAGWDLVRTLFLLCRWCLVLCPHAEETEWSRSLMSLLIRMLIPQWALHSTWSYLNVITLPRTHFK